MLCESGNTPSSVNLPEPLTLWLFALSQGQLALRHHVPEASKLRSQGAGEEERGERPPEQR